MENLEQKYSIADNGCWNWIKAKRGNGYGAIKINKKTISAHRYFYEIYNGIIPQGLFVCHKCDNRGCVNPNHLFLGTQKDNMQDCKSKNRIVIPFRPFKKGHKAANSKLSDSDVIEVLQRINSGEKLISISKQMGITYQTIRDIHIGRSYINIANP